MSAATIKGISVEELFQVSDVQTLMEEDGHPGPIIYAVFARIGQENAEMVEGGRFGYSLKACVSDTRLEIQINRTECIPWIGKVLLETHGTSPLQRSDFTLDWQDQLPEKWREIADIQLLKAGNLCLL